MTRRTARRGGQPAPYTKRNKHPRKYPGVPLHKSGDGVPVTEKSVAAFMERLGIKKPRFRPERWPG